MNAIEDVWKRSGQRGLFTFHLTDLQIEAQRLGLKKTGRKGELVDRVDAYYRTQLAIPSLATASNNNLQQQPSTTDWLVNNANAALAEASSHIEAIMQRSSYNDDTSVGNNNNNNKRVMMSLLAHDQNSKRFKPEIAEDQVDDIEAMLLSHLNNVILAGDRYADSKDKAQKPGHDFCCETDVDSLPLVSVYGWELKYPCDVTIADNLVRLSTPAQYEVGDESVLDFNECRCWQIADSRAIKFHHQNNSNSVLLSNNSTSRDNVILEAVRRILAPHCPAISAKFDKLVTFPTGSFFKPHRDQRHHANHFGSLVLHLPCHYKGGQFIVRNGDQGRTFSFSIDSELMLKCHLVAFSIDCEQEVRPVTDGCRVTLNYQLTYCHDEDILTLMMANNSAFSAATGTALSPTLSSALPKSERRIADCFYQLLLLPKWRGKQAGVLLKQQYYDLASLKPISLQGIDRLIYNALNDCANIFDVQVVAIRVLPDYKICYRLQFLPPVKSEMIAAGVETGNNNNNNNNTNNNGLSPLFDDDDQNKPAAMTTTHLDNFYETAQIEDVTFINSSDEHSTENQLINIGAIFVRLINNKQ